MLDKNIPWLHCRYVVDGDYVRVEDAPILAKMIRQNTPFFWDGHFCYSIEKVYIKKWPDWRNKLRINYEKPKKRKPRYKPLI